MCTTPPWLTPGGQVERANGLILQGLKARIFDPIEKYGSKWIQELPRVVWGLRTQRSRATGYSPFFMVYGFEAILPTDIAFGAPHTRTTMKARPNQLGEQISTRLRSTV